MKTRESSFELLRIISMIMIVAFHTFRYISTKDFSCWQMLGYHAVRWYGLFGVNCFLIISAYFLIDRPVHTHKLIPLVLQTGFYCILLFICNIIYSLIQGHFSPVQDILNVELDALFAPLWSSRYWFITAYLFLYLLVPFLNRLIQKISFRQYRYLIYILSAFVFLYQTLPQTLSNTSVICDIIWVSYVYLLTGYLKLHAQDNVLKRHAGLVLLVAYCLFVLSKQMDTYLTMNRYVSHLLEQTTGNSMRYSFMMLLLAVSLFYVFERIHIQSFAINTIASCTFGVYLFHENKLFHICELLARKWMHPFLQLIPSLALFMLFLVIFQFALGTLIELLRKKSLAPLVDPFICHHLEPLCHKWDTVVNRFIG